MTGRTDVPERRRRIAAMLLAIDTSAGTDVAVVTGEGRIIGEARFDDPRAHAEVIGIAIEAALGEAGIGPEHLTGVVAGMGPGPFTGLRVGVAAARTLAFARGLSLHPMCSHDALAHEWRHDHPEHRGPLLVTTDARRRELALSRYEYGFTSAADGFSLVAPGAVPDTDDTGRPLARTFPHRVSAGHLAQAWLDRERVGAAERPDEIIYLRAPDARPQPLRIVEDASAPRKADR